METPITQELYEWMHKRRIVTAVAQIMGISDSTLSSKLRPSANQARLSADELIPLFDAIREVGYGKPLDGLLYPFVKAMQDAEVVKAEPAAMMSEALILGKGVGELINCAACISKLDDPEEIKRLKVMVRTEMLPIVLQMEALLDQRLKKVNRSRRELADPPPVATDPQSKT